MAKIKQQGGKRKKKPCRNKARIKLTNAMIAKVGNKFKKNIINLFLRSCCQSNTKI
jgi:hypothetical protein